MRSSLWWFLVVGCWSGCVTGPPQTVVCQLDDATPAIDHELTRVLDLRELADTRTPGVSCERITDAAAWRRLQTELGQANQGLPDDWCDFGRDCVLFVAFGPGGGRSAGRPSIATEEGVDVVTLTSNLAAPDDRQSAGVLLVVPRRARSTAVVLRRFRDHVPIDETTLRVFDPLQ